MRSIPPLLFLLTGALCAQPAAPSLQDLVTNSPFGTAVQATNAGLSGTSLEFRGTFVESGERFFSVLDPNTRRAEWVGLNEPGRPFTVTSYDAERETIVLAYQGRNLDLKLHAARIGTLPPPTPATAQTGQQNSRAPPSASPSGPSTSEAQRLAQVAEEIRRRRALRQQAQQQASGNQPSPNDPPRNQ
jgi:hypothetical protein